MCDSKYMDIAKELYKIINKEKYFTYSFVEDCLDGLVPPEVIAEDYKKYGDRVNNYMTIETYTKNYNELKNEYTTNNDLIFSSDEIRVLDRYAKQSDIVLWKRTIKKCADLYFENMLNHPTKGDSDIYVATLYLILSKNPVKFYNKKWFICNEITGIYEQYDEADYIFKSINETLENYIDITSDKLIKTFENNNNVEDIENKPKKIRSTEENNILLKHKLLKENRDKIEKKITNASSLNGVITSIKYFVSVKTATFDANMDLYGFQNGVYCFTEGKFRKAHADEYVSMTCGWDFPVGFNPKTSVEDENEIKMKSMLKRNFPDDEDRKGFIRQIVGAMGNFSGRYAIITRGGAENGKSLLYMQLLQRFFGSYFCSLSSSLIFGAPNNRDTNDSLMVLKNKRFAIMSEPTNTNMNCNALKQLTGGDVVEGRGIYEKKSEFIPRAQINILTNDNINIPDQGDAMKSRIVYNEMSSVFRGQEWFDANVGEGKLFATEQDCFNKNIYKKDAELATWCKTDVACQALLKQVLRLIELERNTDRDIFAYGYTKTPNQEAFSNDAMNTDNDHFKEFMTSNYLWGVGVVNNIKQKEIINNYNDWIKARNSRAKETGHKSIKALGEAPIKQKLEKEYCLEKYKSNGIMTYKNIKVKENVNIEKDLTDKYRHAGQKKIIDEIDEIDELDNSSKSNIQAFFQNSRDI